MDLFGKKSLASLRERLDEVERELGRVVEARDHYARSLDKQTLALQAAREEAEEFRRRAEKAEEQAIRAKEALAQAEKMVAWISEKEAKARAEAVAARNECDGWRARAEGLAAEVERLRAAIEEARRASRGTSEPPPRHRQATADDVERLRKENEGLRRKIAEQAERLKVALRKAEHNRRAWLVTQMQLDLAEDRLYLLTHGKPRPVLVTRKAPAETQGEGAEDETIEERTGLGPSSGTVDPSERSEAVADLEREK